VIVTGGSGRRATVSGMVLSPDRVTAQRERPLAQPDPPAWSTALVPSQRRAAERRTQLARRRSVQRWLQDFRRR
jgi:hypothetical protein